MRLEFEYFYFVLIHLELKRNHTRYQTKMSKIDTRFRTKKVQRVSAMSRHTAVSNLLNVK